ncbi:MAG: efflux transporter periplasmic adaptor subunit [Candidatus Dactylopiibacterium carminicum]|nr:MAG: efflux transporter periplasmic adaptor subunit [Candidatus Dactylopiibacterium carminicum]
MNRISLPRPAVAVLTLAALTLAACGKGPQNGAAGAQMPPAEVGVVTLQPETVELSTVLQGRTSPYAIAEIRPQVGGILRDRAFTEGGLVKAGQLLYQIEPATYEAAYASAQASLARSEASLTTARLKAERYADLVKIKAVSQQDFDDAQATFKQAEASVAADRAALEQARINLAYTRVTSPISGRIGKSEVTQGALLTASQATALTTVQRLDPIYVDLTQSVAELSRLRRAIESGALKGGEARVRLLLEDGVEYPIEGRLAFTDVSVDTGTGSVTVRAVFPNPKQELLPGMFVRARVTTGIRENALLVPQQGVSRNTKGEAVLNVAVSDGKFEQRVVRTDQAIGSRWLMDAGVDAGDQVIVEGLQKLRPGTVIKPVPVSASPAVPAAR